MAIRGRVRAVRVTVVDFLCDLPFAVRAVLFGLASVPALAACGYAYFGAVGPTIPGFVGGLAAVGALTWWYDRPLRLLNAGERAEVRRARRAERFTGDPDLDRLAFNRMHRMPDEKVGWFVKGVWVAGAVVIGLAPFVAAAKFGSWWFAALPSCWAIAALGLPIRRPAADALPTSDTRMPAKTG